MEQEKFQLFKVRPFTEVINDTIAFGRAYFRQYGYALLVLVVPLYLLGAVIYSSGIKAFSMATSFFRNLSDMGATSGLSLLGTLVILIGAVVMHLVFISTFMAVERSIDGRIEHADIMRGIRNIVGRMLMLYFIIGIITLVIAGVVGIAFYALASINAIGLMVLIGIALFCGIMYFAIPLTFLSIVYVREELQFGEAISRCFYLIRDNYWWTFLILIVAGIIGGFAAYIFQLPYLVLTFMKAFSTARSGRFNLDVSIIDRVAMGFSQFGSIVTTTVTAIATYIQYYSLLEKKDGTTLLSQIEQIGTENETNGY